MKKEKYDELLTFQKRERDYNELKIKRYRKHTHIYIHIYINLHEKSIF